MSDNGLKSDAEQHGIPATCRCGVCMLEYWPASGKGDGESLTTLRCMHVFHTCCIRQWATIECCDVQSVRCPYRCELNACVAAAIGIEAERLSVIRIN
jgi:hypothetical protein